MAAQRDAATTESGEPTGWERSWAATDRWVPYVLLAFSTTLSLLSPEQPRDARLGTLALAGLAAAWLALGHTVAPAHRRRQPVYALVYVAGLLAIASALMSRDLVFFIFAISGFLHAAGLRPLPMVFVGTGTTSLLILYFTWGGFPQTAGATIVFVSIFVIQTLLIGFGVVGGEKLAQLSEERRTTVAELEATIAENEALQARVVQQARETGINEERQRMAREIHDTLAQGLTGVITQLEAAGQTDHDPVTRRHHLDNAATLARQSLAEARRSVQALAPGALEHGRLPDALDEQVRTWSRLHGVAAETIVTGATVSLPAAAEVALLRVAQEALTNVGKHADATRVGVTLSLLDDRVLLDVRDDGRGFDLDATREHTSFGLIAMRQRLAALGGTLEVESRPGAGTAISASLPVPVREPADA
jgi:signal transduction histidine kinase